ncbi:MAG: phytoene desaturase family protein [Anaerolineales bacterium]
MVVNSCYDALIIGAGHNGLVTAAYLAKAGLKVLVLERRDTLGGIAVTEEVFPGFKFDTVAHSLGGLRQQIVRDLDLARHGLEVKQSDVSVFTPLPSGNTLLLCHDMGQSLESLRRHSRADADRWPAFSKRMAQLAAVLEAIDGVTIPPITTTNLAELIPLLGVGEPVRRLGKKGLPEFLRVLPMSVAELLNDWFETDALKGTLGASGVHGLTQGPRSTGTSFLFLHHHIGLPLNVFRAARMATGGIGAFAQALASAAKGFGAQIRTGAEAAQVIVKNDKAVGVALAGDGEEVSARLIISSADPKRTLLKLVDPLYLDPQFLWQVRNIKMRGAVAKVNLALDELPNFTALSRDGAPAHLRGLISISPSLDYLERAYDAAKYGEISPKPYLEAVIPSLLDPSRAPAGKHVMSIHAQYAPYHLKGGWNDQRRDELGDHVVNTLAEYAPNIKTIILHRQVLTPADLEETYGLTEGNLNHGEMMLDQILFMRPVPGWAQYRTPIAGLYLCGAGTHPGGGVTGGPGLNAARQILKDMKV